MGYLQDFAKRLDELMLTCAVSEEARLKITARAMSAVLESYKNGVKKGEAERRERTHKPPRRTARRAR